MTEAVTTPGATQVTATPGAPPPVSASPAPAPASGTDAASRSFLETVVGGAKPPASATAASSPAADGRPENVPEKFWDADSKSVRTEAVLDSYRALEQRMKDGGAPPKTAEEYTFQAPEEFKDLALDEKRTAEFRTYCHGLGLTNKQYQGIMERYMGTVQDMAEMSIAFQQDECKRALEQQWKTPAEFEKHTAAAMRAFASLADEDTKAELVRLGNNPHLIRILAKVGLEMAEDAPGGGVHILPPEDVVALMRNPAYTDPKNPEHERIKKKVEAHFAAGGVHPNAPKSVSF